MLRFGELPLVFAASRQVSERGGFGSLFLHGMAQLVMACSGRKVLTSHSSGRLRRRLTPALGLSLSIAEFQSKSASPSELVLPFSEALEALQLMVQSGVSVVGWEGWLRYPNGKLGHSQRHQGTESAPALSQAELYAWLRSTMQDSQVEHIRNPEVSGSELLFCITHQA